MAEVLQKDALKKTSKQKLTPRDRYRASLYTSFAGFTWESKWELTMGINHIINIYYNYLISNY